MGVSFGLKNTMERVRCHEHNAHLRALRLGTVRSNVSDEAGLGNGRLRRDVRVRRGLRGRADSERDPRHEDGKVHVGRLVEVEEQEDEVNRRRRRMNDEGRCRTSP